ncbi:MULTISPECIES: DUF2528 family protein [unclassified Marinimicrobium]|jgi:hypothetical protein|uniref:DUF2528 family protein n=1 Tax=unclassified Marinimicrobium TaxID=2632100 RepID=UPI000C4B0128|nr:MULTISPECIES: DUF2528 family protein [unclassified Marinimicrobium]MAN51183.1 hypothetical protein [Marinimicrobium sp.]|tara:strand:- start:48 stop:401 length:354 start_codon:yes stop_codon:yes gene_type:complete
MKRRFKLESGLDISITLDIDLDKVTPEVGEEINNFWILHKDVLRASGGDVIQAVARRAAGPLLLFLVDGYNGYGAVEKLSEEEGWPHSAQIGITVVDCELPDLSADEFDVHEIKETS